MTEGNDALERNLERLIRKGAPPAPDAARARREFLGRVEGKFPNAGRRIAMAASLLAVAAILYSFFVPQAPARTPEAASQESPPGVPPSAREGERPAPAPSPVTPLKAAAATEPAPVQQLVAKDEALSVSFSLPAGRAPLNAPILFQGRTPYPDKAQVRAGAARAVERYVGGRLLPIGFSAGKRLVEVRAGRFDLPAAWQGPGEYDVDLHLVDDPSLADALKNFSKRDSAFEFLAWRDDLVGQLGPKVDELSALASECLDVLAKYEKVASQESTWVKEKKNVDPRGADFVLTREAEQIVADAGKLKARLETSDVRVLFPAAHGEVFLTMQSLQGIWRTFVYEGGKFSGAKSYHAGGGKMKTHRNEDFEFDTVRKYLQEAAPIAGREMALWIVKDLRRTQGVVRQDHLDALKAYGGRPGLAPVADRLSTAKLEDLEGLEFEVRKGPR